MAKNKRNEVAAGVFVVIALSLTLGVVVWLGASDLLKAGGQIVYFSAPSSDGPAGLQEGSDVMFGDRAIGKITRIDIRPDQGVCIYQARIDRKDIVVHADANAVILSPVIGSARLGLLRAGTSRDMPDENHPLRLSGGLNQAMTDLGVATAKLRTIAENMNMELDPNRGDSILAGVRGVVADIKIASGAIARTALNVQGQTDPNSGSSFLSKLNALARNLVNQTDASQKDSLVCKIHKSVDDVNAMTADARPKVEKTLTAVQSMSERLDGHVKKDIAELLAKISKAGDNIVTVTDNFVSVSADAKDIVGSVGSDRIREIIDNLTLVSADLKATAREVRRNPWRLMYTPTDKELNTQNVYDSARAFMQGAEQLDLAIRRLNDISKANPQGVKADDPQLKEVRDHLKETFEHFQKVEGSLWKELQKTK